MLLDNPAAQSPARRPTRPCDPVDPGDHTAPLQDSRRTRPESAPPPMKCPYKADQHCQTNGAGDTPLTASGMQNPPADAPADTAAGSSTDTCEPKGSQDATAENGELAATVPAAGDPSQVPATPAPAPRETVVANDAVAGLAVPPADVPPPPAPAGAAGSGTDVIVPPAAEAKSNGIAVQVSAQAGTETAGSSEAAGAAEASTGTPAAAAPTTVAAPPAPRPGTVAPEAQTTADGSPSGRGSEHPQSHTVSTDAPDALSKKPGLPSGKPQDETDADPSRATAKLAADTSQLAVPLQQHPADRFGHLTPAAPAAHTGTAATAETSTAVPIAGLAVEIAARAQAGGNRFEIRLDPPELGRIDVRLDVDHRGHVTSRLVVEKSETLDLLRRDAPELERALQQAGLKTGDGGLQFTLRDQQFAGRDDNPPASAARVVVPDTELAPVESAPSGYGRWSRLDGGLDIRV